MAKLTNVTRRGFLKRSAALLAAPTIIPASALGQGDRPPPSERIVMGGIGLGGRGQRDLTWLMGNSDVQFVATCDVRRDRREQVKAKVDQAYGNTDCATYRDLRDLLARDDIDGVLIAISDRWHTLAATMAMRAGKDVYCEKPCSMTIAQSRALADAGRRYGRVFQAGTQRRSEPNFVFIVQLARMGLLGELHKLTGHIMLGFARHQWLPPEPEPPRDEVDWDLFLGPIPWRPFNSKYLGRRLDHADIWTGGIGEWGAHTFDLCQWANDTVYTAAVDYQFPGNDTGEGLVAHYANGVELFMTRESFAGTCGVRFEGSEGKAQCSDRQQPEVEPASLLGEKDRILQQYVDESGRSLDHMRDFLDCVKSRRHPTANADVAHGAHSTSHAATICMHVQRDLKYDPDKEEFVGDDDANRMRSRSMRAPYTL